MLSSPPVNSSLLQVAKEPPKQSRSMFVVGGAALALAALAWLASDRHPTPPPQTATGDLPTLPTAPERVVPTAPPPTSATQGVPPVNSAAEGTTAAAPAHGKPRPRSTVTGPVVPKPNPGANDEKTLFSGRK